MSIIAVGIDLAKNIIAGHVQKIILNKKGGQWPPFCGNTAGLSSFAAERHQQVQQIDEDVVDI